MLVVSNGVQANRQHKDEVLPSFRPSIEETLRDACLLIMMRVVTISPRWRRGVLAMVARVEGLRDDPQGGLSQPLYTRLGLELLS